MKCFSKNFSSEIVLMNTYNAVLKTPPERFQTKARNVRCLWEFCKIQTLGQTFFLSNCSYGHVEGSFYNPPEENLTKGRKISVQIPKKTKKVDFLISPLKFFFGDLAGSFDNSIEKKIARRPEILRSLSENDQNKIRFSNSCFSSNSSSGYVDCCFDKPAEKRRREADIFGSMSESV